MRIFLDANILFSAAKSAGAVRQLLASLADAGHTLWADGFVAEEARRNIHAKFPAAVHDLETLLSAIHLAPAQPSAALPDIVSQLPEKDRPVLGAAIRLKCDALVTGDKTHFGHWYGKRIAGVQIHSPASLAQALLR